MPRLVRLTFAVMITAMSAASSACRDFAVAWGTDPIEPRRAAELYVAAALQLAQHDPQLVQDFRGPGASRPGPRVPVTEIAPSVATLAGQLSDRTIETPQVRYLLWQTRALELASRRLLGQRTTFADEARALFGHIPIPADAAIASTALQRLERLLPGDGPLAERLIAYRRRIGIPDDRRRDVFAAALGACRSATQAATRLIPDDESVEITFVGGLGWDGYTRYLGNRRSRIEINVDTPLDVSRALQLACHEGYPGHHLQYLLWDTERSRGHRPELDLTPAFGPHFVIAEGAAEAAADLVMPADERERVYRDILLPAAGLPAGEAKRLVAIDDLVSQTTRATTPIIREYLDGRLSSAAAAERLSHDALIPSPDRFLAFVDRVRTRAIVYSEGRLVLRGYLESHGLQDGLWRLFVGRPFALE